MLEADTKTEALIVIDGIKSSTLQVESTFWMIKVVNQVVVFLLELVMFGSFACFGYSRSSNTIVKYISASLLVFIAIALWSVFAAPKSSHRLPMPGVALFRAIMFLIGALLLYLLNVKAAAIFMGILAVITQLISSFTEPS